MNNSDMPAMPLPSDVYEEWIDLTETKKGSKECFGLTKREHFAAIAMQGLISNPVWMKSCTRLPAPISECIAVHSLEMADSLLVELEKGNE